jgi:hypothetical protein
VLISPPFGKPRDVVSHLQQQCAKKKILKN